MSWPYRPKTLTELLEPEIIRLLLGQGLARELRSDVAVFERDAAGLRRIDEPRRSQAFDETAFQNLFRREKHRGKVAFEGADELCRQHESRLAERVLGGDLLPEDPESGELPRARGPLGLVDLACPVVLSGSVVAVIVAGARLVSEDDRPKVQKRIGKLGKLTQAEVRSLESSGAEVVAPIRPAEDACREHLIEAVAQLRPVDESLPAGLRKFAQLLAELADSRSALLRASTEEGLLHRLLPPGERLPLTRADVLRWLDSSTVRLRDLLDVAWVAVFSRLPEDLGKETAPLRLLSVAGLDRGSGRDRVDLRGRAAVVELHLAKLGVGTASNSDEAAIDPVELGVQAVSSLIGALRASPRAPEGWKDTLTKGAFVAAYGEHAGLELVVLVGPVCGELEPRRADLGFLLRATRRLGERYLLGASESIRRRSSERIEKLDEAERLQKLKRASPLKPQRFDLRKLLDERIESASSSPEGPTVAFDLKGFSDRLLLEGDRQKLARVVDTILARAVEWARPLAEGATASVLISSKRSRRRRDRHELIFDVVGHLLDSATRRELFRSEPTRAASPQNGDGKSGQNPDSSSASIPASRSQISFREAQQIVTWHWGRLSVESTRTDSSSDGEARGRTLIQVELPETIPLGPPPGSRRSDRGQDRRGDAGSRTSKSSTRRSRRGGRASES